MAKKNLYEGELLKTDDWGGPIVKNDVTYDAASGAAVQGFIKDSLNNKWGCGHDNNKGKYYIFADEESRDLYLEYEDMYEKEEIPEIPAEIQALKLAEMNSYSNYQIRISLITEETMPNNAILVGQTGNKVAFIGTTTDKDENEVLESYNVSYTITRPDGSKTVVNHFATSGKREELNVDNYLAEGQNVIAINILGGTSNVVANTTVVYQVINLKVTDNYDISQVHNLSNGGTSSLQITWAITGSSVSGKFIELYVDGEEYELPKEAVVPSGADNGRISTTIDIDSSFAEGRHNFQYRAWLTINDKKFYTKTYSRDFIVYKGGNDPIIAIAYEIPIGYDPLTGDTYQTPVIYDAVQYTSFILPVAVYKNGAAYVNTVVSLQYVESGETKTDVSYANLVSNGQVWESNISPTVTGNTTVKIVAGDGSSVDEYDINVQISKNELDVRELTAGLVLDLNAKGRNNKSADKDTWTFGDITTLFSGFTWDDTSGWNGKELVISNNNTLEIDYKPFIALDVENSGITFEIEFSTFNVSDDNAVICDITGQDGSGLLITASEAIFTDSSKNKVSTKFKSNENNRIAFVVDPETQGKPIMLIYVNGAICGGVGYSIGTSHFTSTKKITISGSPFVSVRLKHIRIYSLTLSPDEVLNNYMLYRDTYYEMEEIYNKNDLYASAGVFDLEKIANVLPIMLLTDGDDNKNRLERLMSFGTADKSTLIRLSEVLYINNLDPSTNFYVENAQMSCQGTSSMNYPIKNLRLYIKDKAKGKYGDWDLPVTYTGDTSDPEKMVTIEHPKGTGIPMKDGKGKIAFKSSLPGTFSEGEKKAQKVNCWTLKADYAESSSSHNTGVARIWNKVMRDALLGGEHVSETKAQETKRKAGSKDDIRTSVDGFPIVVFHRYSKDDINWKFVGKYNFNNDKSTESVFGFCDIAGVQYQSYDYNDIDEATFNEAYANDPTQCSSSTFNYETEAAMITAIRNRVDKNKPDEETGEYEPLTEADYITKFLPTPYQYSKEYQKSLVYIGGTLTLEYYKQKYLVSGDTNIQNYCFEVLENEAPVTNYTAPVSTFDSDWAHGFESRYPEIDDKVDDIPDAQTKGGITNLRDLYSWIHSTMYTQEAYDEDPTHTVTIAGEIKRDGDLTYKQTVKEYMNNGTYVANGFEDFQELKKQKFQKEKWDHLDVFKTAAYYVYLMRFGAVDQVCKNSMITSEGTYSYVQNTTVVVSGEGEEETRTAKVAYEELPGNHSKWFFINYDNDTILGLDNDGQMSYGPDIDRKTQSGSGYWMEHDHPTEDMKGYWDEIANPSDEEKAGANTDYTSLEEIRTAVSDGELVLDDQMKFLAGGVLYIWNQTASKEYESIDDLKRAVTNGDITPQKGDRYQIGGSVWEWSNDSAYAYAGHNSVLWNNLEDDEEFMTVVADMDQALFEAGLTYNDVIDIFNAKQANMWCEKILNKDAINKYIDQYCNKDNNHLSKMHGPRTSHRMWWLSKRFTYFDSKFVSGEYKNAKILIKCQGDCSNPIFTIQPTEYMNYGWGVTSRSIGQTGISAIKDDQGHLLPLSFDIRDGGLSTSMSIGDVLEIYASPYISEIDFSNFAITLTSFDMGSMQNSVLGTQLKKLTLGRLGLVNSGDKALKPGDFGGLKNADKLEYLNIESMRGMTSIDLTENVNLKDLRAFDSGLLAIAFANGAKIEHIELPSCFNNLNLDGANYLDVNGIVFENDDKTNLSTIRIKNCELLKETSFEFIRDWYQQKNGNFESCVIDMEGIDWKILYSDLDIIEELKTKCRTFTLKGTVTITDTIEGRTRIETKDRVTRIKTLFGENCFLVEQNPPVVVTCVVPFIIINATETEISANKDVVVTYSCEVYPSIETDKNPSITYEIVSGQGYEEREGVYIVSNQDFTGTLTTDELVIGWSSVLTIRATYQYQGSNRFTSEIELEVLDPTYPEDDSMLTLSGPTSLKKNNVYTYGLTVLDEYGDEASGSYDVTWSFDNNHSIYIDYEQSGVLADNQNRFKIYTTNEEPDPSETIRLTARVTTYAGDVINKTIKLLILNDNVILTSDSNPIVLDVCRTAGWVQPDAEVLTKDEALAVTNIGTYFSNVSGEFGFHEFAEFENVHSIPEGAFRSSGVTGLTTPSGITEIGASAFTYCRQLKSITFDSGNTVTTIPNSCFLNCISLSNLVLPDTVRTIEAMAFGNTVSIKKIALSNGNDEAGVLVVPNTLTNILEQAFEVGGAANQTIVSFELPDYLGQIENGQLDSLLIRGKYITGFTASENSTYYSTSDGVLYNKTQQTLYKYPCAKVGDSYSPAISCLLLYDYAFADTQLVSINLNTAGALGRMGIKEFANSTKLTTIDMGECNALKTIYHYAFEGCTKLTTIIYPPAVETIGASAFSSTHAMTQIVLPNTVKVVGTNVINNCNGITEVIFPDSIISGTTTADTIGNIGSVVYSCPNVTYIKFPAFAHVQDNLCDYNSSLTGVTLPCCSYLDEYDNVIIQFYSRNFLLGSNLPNFVEYKLPAENDNSIYFESGGVLYRHDEGTDIELANVPMGLTSFEIPSNVTSIVSYCFYKHKIQSIVVPDNVKTIGSNCFQESSIQTAEVGKQITAIPNKAFFLCRNLRNVVFKSTGSTTIDYHAFANCENLSAITFSSLSVPTILDSDPNFSDGYTPFGNIAPNLNPSTFTGYLVSGNKRIKVQYFTDGTDMSLDLYKSAQYWDNPLFKAVGDNGCGFDTEYITFNGDIYVKIYDANDDHYQYDGQDTTQLPYAYKDGSTVIGEFQSSGDYVGYYKFSLGTNVISNKPIEFRYGQSGSGTLIGTLRPLAFEDHIYEMHQNAASAPRMMNTRKSGDVVLGASNEEETVSRYDYDKLVSRLNTLEALLKNAIDE